MTRSPRRAAAFALATSLLVSAFAATPAFAAPATPADISALRRMFGLDIIPAAVADSVLRSGPGFKDPALQGCARPVLVAAYARNVDDSLRAAIPDHESVVAWLEFATTPGGKRLVGHLRATVAAGVAGKPVPPSPVESLSAAERADIARFKAGPVGAKGPPKMLDMSAAQAQALQATLASKCSAPTAAAPKKN
jgi:hypothetical protein